jgi:hypothetical protein
MKEINKEIVTALNNSLGLELPEKVSYEDLRDTLSAQINFLVGNDFQKLISILYRVDVSEPKLRSLLKENPEIDAGKIIADLIIERQIQKIKSRQQFTQRDNSIDENEKW